MKKTGLTDLYNALKEEKHEINVREDIRFKARKTLDKILELS